MSKEAIKRGYPFDSDLFFIFIFVDLTADDAEKSSSSNNVPSNSSKFDFLFHVSLAIFCWGVF